MTLETFCEGIFFQISLNDFLALKGNEMEQNAGMEDMEISRLDPKYCKHWIEATENTKKVEILN